MCVRDFLLYRQIFGYIYPWDARRSGHLHQPVIEAGVYGYVHMAQPFDFCARVRVRVVHKRISLY